MLSILVLLLASAAPPDCAYDRAALLALDENAFDQDFAGGWRALEQRGCEAEAADLIRDYRAAAPRAHSDLLAWHEGQVRADLGQTEAAIALFEASRKPPAEDRIGWNLYVDGTIAFLRGDRPALEAARRKLARLPRPKDPPVFRYDGKVVPVAWPLNLNVLDGFRKCFGRPYKEAYDSPCTTGGVIKIKG